MVKGEYMLSLSCDDRGSGPAGCDQWDAITAPTRMECLLIAREKGWMIRQKNKACLCPSHAAELREQGYLRNQNA